MYEEINGLFYDEIKCFEHRTDVDAIMDIQHMSKYSVVKQIIENIISGDDRKFATIFGYDFTRKYYGEVGKLKEDIKDLIMSRGFEYANIFQIPMPDLVFIAHEKGECYGEIGVVTWYDDIKFNQDIGDEWRVIAKITKDGNFYVGEKNFWDKEIGSWDSPRKIIGIGKHPEHSCLDDNMHGSLISFINNIMLDEKYESGEHAFLGDYLWSSAYVFTILPQ